VSDNAFVAVAIHHADPRHQDDMLEFMHRVVAATEGAPGLVEFKACRELSTGVLAGYSRWNSRSDFEAGRAKITSLAPERKPEWTVKPDDLLLLEEA
jgi:heme-degrading monooxygenase HmoA